MEKTLELLWMKQIEGYDPTDDLHQQIADMVSENQPEIDLQLEGTGTIALFGEINDWFLKIEITKDHPERVIISHYFQDEWLDEVNKSKKESDGVKEEAEKRIQGMNVFNEIKPIIINILGVEPMEVTLEADVEGDLGADSLDKVDLVMQIEGKLDIRIEEEFEYKTVQDLVDRVSSGV